MPQRNQSSYTRLKKTWAKQKRYTLATDLQVVYTINKEDFGAFSISAAIRGPYNRCNNPWYRDSYGHSCYY